MSRVEADVEIGATSDRDVSSSASVGLQTPQMAVGSLIAIVELACVTSRPTEPWGGTADIPSRNAKLPATIATIHLFTMLLGDGSSSGSACRATS